MKFSEWKLLREMNEEEGFAQAIKTNPKDMTAWLVYADWLQDRNDPRADLIRALAGKKTTKNMNALDQLWKTYANTDFARLLALTFPIVRDALGFSGRSRSVTLGQIAQRMQLTKADKTVQRQVENVLEQINKILGGHGVESVRGHRNIWNNLGRRDPDTAALYVNMGDTYDQTVLYDAIVGKYRITSLGNFIEKYGDRYGIE